MTRKCQDPERECYWTAERMRELGSFQGTVTQELEDLRRLVWKTSFGGAATGGGVCGAIVLIVQFFAGG